MGYKLFCDKCGKEIGSRDDMVQTEHHTGGLTLFSYYHTKCFDEKYNNPQEITYKHTLKEISNYIEPFLKLRANAGGFDYTTKGKMFLPIKQILEKVEIE